jgi:hypothetical protein
LRVGRSGALVVRGEPGVGKSALVKYLTEQASGCQGARAAGVESEMELTFAGLHQATGSSGSHRFVHAPIDWGSCTGAPA